MSVENLRELASSFVHKAIMLERERRYREAIISYNKAIEILKKLIHLEENPKIISIYEDRIRQYASRIRLLLERSRGPIRRKRVSGLGQKGKDEILKAVEEAILRERPNVRWEDIADLENAKRALMETIVWPMIRPDLFRGSRRPWKGILLFGPPGCGKTLLAKAVATNINATFFNVDSSIILSKWFGESSKIVKELFKVARENQPSVIFIDEVDAIASMRETGEHDAMRRVKTILLSQMDGLLGRDDERVVVIAATNMPEDLDPAFRRRFEKRIYVPPPNFEARKEIFRIHLRDIEVDDDVDLNKLARLTEGYSGSDIALVVREAAMRPIRELAERGLLEDKNAKPRKVNMEDFLYALKIIKPSLTKEEIRKYEEWARLYGSG